MNQSAFQKQPFDMRNMPKQNGINLLNAKASIFFFLFVCQSREGFLKKIHAQQLLNSFYCLFKANFLTEVMF